jgi:hypothetical protein
VGGLISGVFGAPFKLYRRIRRGPAQPSETAATAESGSESDEDFDEDEDFDHEGRFSPSHTLMHIHRDVRAIVDGAEGEASSGR